jgi:hypothetical protein
MTHHLSLDLMHHELTVTLVHLTQAYIVDITMAVEEAMAERA